MNECEKTGYREKNINNYNKIFFKNEFRATTSMNSLTKMPIQKTRDAQESKSLSRSHSFEALRTGYSNPNAI